MDIYNVAFAEGFLGGEGRRLVAASKAKELESV